MTSTHPVAAEEPLGRCGCQFVYVSRAEEPSTHVYAAALLTSAPARRPIQSMLTPAGAMIALSAAWSTALRTTASCSPRAMQSSRALSQRRGPGSGWDMVEERTYRVVVPGASGAGGEVGGGAGGAGDAGGTGGELGEHTNPS